MVRPSRGLNWWIVVDLDGDCACAVAGYWVKVSGDGGGLACDLVRRAGDRAGEEFGRDCDERGMSGGFEDVCRFAFDCAGECLYPLGDAIYAAEARTK